MRIIGTRIRLTDRGRQYGLDPRSTWLTLNKDRSPPGLQVKKVGFIGYGHGPDEAPALIVEADRFFPSSELCAYFGYQNGGLMRDTHWTCHQYGARHGRNGSAALNLLRLALKTVDELNGQLIPGPVGPDVTLLKRKVLAGG